MAKETERKRCMEEEWRSILASKQPSVPSRTDFPPRFIFGASTSAYQVEGAWNEGGRGPSIWDSFSHTEGIIFDESNGDIAADQYHRYKEDIDLIAKLGFGAYRFSISWSRIFPDGLGTKINEEGLTYYNNVINALLERGIQPFVTLYHWDLPLNLEESMGGWLNDQVVKYFAIYAETCFASFGDRVKNWITINEPLQTAVNGYVTGIFAPGRCEHALEEPYLVSHHQLLAHAEAVSIYRNKYRERVIPRDLRAFGGACHSLALYLGLPERVRQLVDEAGFGAYVQTLTRARNDHAVLVALAERWRDTTNTFHLPLGEMTVTPMDFAAITGLRVGGEPIPFDTGIHEDSEALRWFLGEAPRVEAGAARYAQFESYLRPEVDTEVEAEQMARAYLLYLFGASLFPNRRSNVHLSYLPALRDFRTASRFDWGGAALGTAYTFLGDSSRTGQSTAGYWRVWELWAYEVLRMYPPECKCTDLSILPRARKWSKENMGKKEGRGHLNAYRLYLDDLRASQIDWDPWRVAGPELEYLARSRAITGSRVLLESAFGWQWYLGDRVTRQSLGLLAFQVPGPLPARASHTGEYTRAELERFTQPDTDLVRYLRPERDYATYQRDYLAGPLGVRALREVRSQASGAAEERRAAAEGERGGEGRRRRGLGRPVRGGPPEMLWKVAVVDAQRNPGEVHLAPARTEPTPVTVQVPVEWVNEAVRRMLALENLIRRAASGIPLEIHYPAPAQTRVQPAAAQSSQVQGRMSPRRKSTRGGQPPKKVARTLVSPAASSRQARGKLPVDTSQRVARDALARAEERYRVEVRERASRQELTRKRGRTEPEILEEDDDDEEGDGERGEDEERSTGSSGSDGSIDDPLFKKGPMDTESSSDEEE